MNEIDKKIQEIVKVFYHFGDDISQSKGGSWTNRISMFSEIVRLTQEVLIDSKTTYYQLEILEKVMTYIITYSSKKLIFTTNGPKQLKTRELFEQMKQHQDEIKNLKEKKPVSQEHYSNLDEWIKEKNILRMEFPKINYNKAFSLLPEVYDQEYMLYMDMRKVLLTRGSPNSNRIYVIDIANEISNRLTLDIESGRIEASESSMELLAISRLIKSNLPLQNGKLLKDAKKTREEIEAEILKKTIWQCHR